MTDKLKIVTYTDTEKDILIVQVEGFIDEHTNEYFNVFLFELLDKTNRFVLDFANVSYMNSSGLGTLMGVYANLIKKKEHLKLFNVSKKIEDLFKLLGFHHFFKIFNSKEECLSSFE